MALLVACVIAFTRFEGAARWVVIAFGGAIEVVEAAVMIWWSQRRQPDTGAEALHGRTAVAIEDLRPSGRVRIDGEIWNARTLADCKVGDRVRVVSASGLELVVEPEDRPARATRQD